MALVPVLGDQSCASLLLSQCWPLPSLLQGVSIIGNGDPARALSADGKALPGVAPVAKQQGSYVAALLKARLQSKSLPPFHYREFGSLATVGRKRAVAELGRYKFRGFLAWLLWSCAHVYFLIGFRNRLIVALNWAWSYVTFQRGTRLITGISGARVEDIPTPSPPTS